MPHRIAVSLCSAEPLGGDPVSLFLSYLDDDGGVWMFQQTPDGVWAGPQQIGVLLGDVQVVGLVGLQNYLIALGQIEEDGVEYGAASPLVLLISTFSQQGASPEISDWSIFEYLNPQPQDEGGPYDAPIDIQDVSAVLATFDDNTYLLIGAASGDAGLFVFSANLSQSAGIPPTTIDTMGAWIDVGLGSGASSPAIALTSEGSVVFFGISGGFPFGFVSADGMNWDPILSLFIGTFELGALLGGYTSIELTPGNPNETLQAILLNANIGQPILWYDDSGEGLDWGYYGDLLPANVINPPTFRTIAAGFGNDGNLQVVGIGPTVYPGNLPYLIWQDVNGGWSPYPYDGSTGEYVTLGNDFLGLKTQPIDLAIGMGWTGNQAPALQVGYLGEDGNIYINWQDPEGAWHWYAGLDGHGLP